MPGFQSTRLVTEGALEPFFFLYTDDSIQGNPETCKQSSIMLNYEVKNNVDFLRKVNDMREIVLIRYYNVFFYLSFQVGKDDFNRGYLVKQIDAGVTMNMKELATSLQSLSTEKIFL